MSDDIDKQFRHRVGISIMAVFIMVALPFILIVLEILEFAASRTHYCDVLYDQVGILEPLAHLYRRLSGH